MSAEATLFFLNAVSALLIGVTILFLTLGFRNVSRSVGVPQANSTSSEQLQHRLRGLLRFERSRKDFLPVLHPRRLVDDDQLSSTAADVGVADLEVLLRAIIKASGDTPHLVGVNKGGSLVANFLAHRLDLHEKYLIKCDFRTKDYEKLYCEDRDDVSDIVVIDDVVRTGYTISRVKSFLTTKYPRSTVFVVCLVLVDQPSGKAGGEVAVDYHAWYAKSRHVKMPWSHGGESLVPSDFFNDREIDQIVGVVDTPEKTSETKALVNR